MRWRPERRRSRTHKRNWLIGARLACNHGRACRLGTAEKRSPIKIFSGAREPGVSYQQNNGRARRIFRIDFAGNGLAVATVERHCARRTTGGRRESGNQGTEFFSQFVETIIPMSYPGAQKLADHLKIGNAEEQVRVIDLAAGSEIKNGWSKPASKKCANSKHVGHHAHSGNKTVKWRNTNLLFIRTSKCFDLRDENENEVALRNKSPAYREKF